VKIKICPKQKQMGMNVEKEHEDITHGDPKLIEKIVMVHLKENPRYYSELKKIEKD